MSRLLDESFQKTTDLDPNPDQTLLKFLIRFWVGRLDPKIGRIWCINWGGGTSPESPA
jgi:hypothetical protein